METLPDFVAQNSKKRVYSAASTSSASFIDLEDDVVEMPPPVNRVPKHQKQKQIMACEVIDIDEDDDEDNEEEDDVIFIEERKGSSNNGKGSAHKTEVHWPSNSFSADSSGHVNGINSSKNFSSGSHEIVSVDSNGAEYFDDAIYTDSYLDDIMEGEELTLLQAHFDSMDLPTGVEAPLPWYLDPSQFAKKSAVGNALGTNNGSCPKGKLSSSWQNQQPPQIKPSTSQHSQHDQSFQTWEKGETPNAWKKRTHVSGPMLKPVASSRLMNPYVLNPTAGNSYFTGGPQFGPTSQPFPVQVPPNLNNFVGPVHFVPQAGPLMQWLPYSPSQMNTASCGSGANTSESVPSTINITDLDNILRRFENFKKFDIVEDHSDHVYSANGASATVASKGWTKKIQEEWKILEDHLPDMIFVRAYESRMDLLRAVIIGADGTPYHDGLFFFDVFFPSQYPSIPPRVHYHSGGLRINPNLYNDGKVCLSLLNTWQGNKEEMWIPGKSNMLQVLVSIQGLILNEKPYFNEPGYARMGGTERGEAQSRPYNENVFTLSLKTMSYSIRRPPKHFEDFVVGHFHKRAHDILAACKAYKEGAMIGSFVKGSAQPDNQAQYGRSSSYIYSLSEYVNMLVKDFTSIGVKDCEAFSIQLESKNGSSIPAAGNRRIKFGKGLHIGSN